LILLFMQQNLMLHYGSCWSTWDSKSAVYLDKAADFVNKQALAPALEFLDDKILGALAGGLKSMKKIAGQIKEGAAKIEK